VLSSPRCKTDLPKQRNQTRKVSDINQDACKPLIQLKFAEDPVVMVEGLVEELAAEHEDVVL
jgi:hypothetical protein